MARNLETITFDPARFRQELDAFGVLLASSHDLSETRDIQPLFKRSKQLSAYMGTFAPNIGPATELAFEFPFFGDFKADVLLGNKRASEFCVIEFEDGRRNSVFKKQPNRGNPEWSPRFEHGFSQLVDWFYNLDDFKNTKNFIKTFGDGHIRLSGLLIVGRDTGLDDAQRSRLKWRSEKILIDSHAISCITFDELYSALHSRFERYGAAFKLQKPKKI